MTKLKNTKKGMAKKALSISLVAAMLATSNVPVWAAEFTDGTDAVVEAPVVEEFAAEAPVEEVQEAPVVAAPEVSGNQYSVTLSAFTYNEKPVENNKIVWDGKKLSTNLTIKEENPIEGVNLKAAWKVGNDVIQSTISSELTAGQTYPCHLTIGSEYASKTISLYVYAQKEDGTIAWSYTSEPITVEAKDVTTIAKANANDVAYTGDVQKAVPTVSAVSGALPTELNGGSTLEELEKNYVVGYDETDLTNVTGNEITITLTPKNSAYKGNLTAKYKITSKALNGNFDQSMTAKFKNVSLMFNGGSETLVKVKKSDIELVDKKSKADLSNYLDVDENGYVDVDIANDGKCWISLIHGVPETGIKNYDITPEAQASRRILSSNVLEIKARDLNTVDVSIARKPAVSTGKITLSKSDITFVDKESKKELKGLYDFVDITVPSNAAAAGTYTVDITPKNGQSKVTGSATATLYVYATNIADTGFGTHENPRGTISNPVKYYTGEEVTFSKDEIGAPMYKDAPLRDDEYTISYGNNVDAGTATMFVIGQGAYANSIRKVNFEIKKTPVSSVSVNKYVEKIDTTRPEDYKEALALAVKGKIPGTNKELTLKEGKDYTVKYSFGDVIVDGVTGKGVTATVTLTTKNPNFVNSDNVTMSASALITKATLKPEHIKLKEGSSFTYTGKAIEPKFDVVIGGHYINSDLYKTEYTNNVEAGTGKLTITGKDNSDYQGSASVEFTINSADASKLVGAIASRQYTGYSLEIPADEIDLTLDGNVIDVAKNFTLTYGENLNIGEGTVTLTPKNKNFTGSKTLTFNIVGEMLEAPTKFVYHDKDGFLIIDSTKKFTHNGTAQKFAKTEIKHAKTLKAGTDYELVYVDNVYGQKGTDGKQYAAVLAVAKGKYGGELTKSSPIAVKKGVYTDAEGNKTANVFGIDLIEITPETVYKSNITVSNGVYAAGLPVKPSVSISVQGRTLVEGKDYDLDLSANKDIVNATEKQSLSAKINFKNGYAADTTISTKAWNWGIDKFNLANAVVTVDGDKVTVKCGSVDVPSSEYTVTRDAAADTVTVTATKDNKNYTGSKTVSAVITEPAEKPAAPMITDVQVKGNNATVILSGDSEGAVGYDYVISKDRNCINNKKYAKVNKNILTTKTTFTYTGQGTYYAYCHAWKKVDGKKVFSDWSNAYPFVVTSITPEQPAITSVKVSKNTVKVTYTKSANATGYDLVLGKSMKKVNGEMRPVNYGKLVKKVYKGNTVTATFTKVPKGTYYVGLHAYNRTSEDGKKVFSPWSNARKVVVK